MSGNVQSKEDFKLGDWIIHPDRLRLTQNDDEKSVESRVMELLLLLCEESGKVYAREKIEQALWPDVIVGEDTVARTVSKLRRALGCSANNPSYIETIPKRGYRLLKEPQNLTASFETSKPTPLFWQKPMALVSVAVLIAIGFISFSLSNFKEEQAIATPPLLQRADDLYMRFTHADNEASVALYEKILATEPDNARAQAGLANTLVQRVVRWQGAPQSNENSATSIEDALEKGLHQTTSGQEILARATAMAERAARLAPNDPDVQKALGLSLSAQGNVNRAKLVYQKTIRLDPDAWEAMINLAELHQISGEADEAIKLFEQAYQVMDKTYTEEPQRIGPWQGALGTLIGKLHLQQKNLQQAELWFRQVLTQSPYQEEATVLLAKLLLESGDTLQAKNLCETLIQRIGPAEGCQSILEK